MRYARISTDKGAVPVEWFEDHWMEIDSAFVPHPRRTGRSWAGEVVRLLAPCEPRVVVGMSANGSPEARALPPHAFLKSARTVCGPGAGIVLDDGIGAHAVEGELAVVIGRPARHLDSVTALTAVLGYTIVNDVTATDQVPLDALFTQVKNGDGFTPLGPWIETELEPNDVKIRLTIDGKPAVEGSTRSLARSIVEQLVYVTSVMELGPGDVLLTGCPGTTVPIRSGQRCTITIDGIGSLENETVPGHARASV